MLQVLKTDALITRATERYLELVETELVEREQRLVPFADGSITPMLPGLSAGIKKVVTQFANKIGKAIPYDGKATAIPMANVFVEDGDVPVRCYIAGWETSVFELDAMAAASANGQPFGSNLESVLSETATMMIDEAIHLSGAFGESDIGTTGFINDPGIPLNDTSFDPYNPTTTAEEIKSFVVDAYGAIRNNTKLRYMPNIMLCTEDFRLELIERNISGTNTSIMAQLRDDLNIAAVIALNELSAEDLQEYAGTAGTKERFMFYNLNDYLIRRRISAMGTLPAQRLGTNIQTIVYQAAGAIQWRFPTTAVSTDFLKKS